MKSESARIMAERSLKDQGYTKKTCPLCAGTGHLEAMRAGAYWACSHCVGMGYTWQAPITK